MSSAAATGVAPRVSSMAATVAWVALASVLALGAAGLVARMTHQPGGPAREELTYPGDRALSATLDDASARLQQIAADVDKMAAAAKSALEAVSAANSEALTANLESGGSSAVLIAFATDDLRQTLAGLPGDGPDATIQFSNATLVRRAAILAARDAASGLAEQWANVTGRSKDAAQVTALLQNHDSIVASAAALGRRAAYGDAMQELAKAIVVLEELQVFRNELIKGGEVTVLDEWIARHLRYDKALTALYKALQAGKGRNTLDVQAAFREERLAFAQLPADSRSIVVIVAEIARGGLNQAVLAIEDARGRIDRALSEASPT
jgi:hypothetical protein